MVTLGPFSGRLCPEITHSHLSSSFLINLLVDRLADGWPTLATIAEASVTYPQLNCTMFLS
jgi:hypothetical protein